MNNIDKIIELIFEEHKKDNEKQEAFKKIFEIVSPDANHPYIEINVAEKMNDIVKLIYPALAEDISYFLYEAPSFYKKGGCRITDEKTQCEIIIDNEEEAIEYLIDNY